MNIGFIFAFGAALTWGLVYVVDQKILVHLSPFTLLLVYTIVQAIVLIPFLFVDFPLIRSAFFNLKSVLPLVILSVVLGLLADFFIFSGIKNLDASTASVLEIAYPFFVVLFSFIFFRVIPNSLFFVGSAFIFLGSFIIIKFGSAG